MCEALEPLNDQYNFEFVITDNCSTDNTFSLLQELAASDRRVRVFRFSRNFGYQKSIWTGYSKARGDAAIEFDCDLQDPPELLRVFLKHWEEGNHIVYGIRKKRKEGVIVTWARQLYYRLINRISENYLPLDAGDFMLIDRVILDCLQELNDQNLYLRGTIFSYGYQQKGVPYERHARLHGISKFPIRKMFGLAIDGIISQSVLPLRVASYVGLLVAVIMTVLSGGYMFARFFGGFSSVPGFTTTTVLILLSISLNAIFLGVIGEYLSRIYVQIKHRPMTIIQNSIESDSPVKGS
jgi:dolichol-phosphate mannosyltransferase